MKIDIVREMLDKHSDEEVIAYLDSVLTGLLQNYKTALEKGRSELLWGNLGDITLTASIIRTMKHRNEARETQKQM